MVSIKGNNHDPGNRNLKNPENHQSGRNDFRESENQTDERTGRPVEEPNPLLAASIKPRPPII